jgi:hypothetical protein
MEVGAAHGDWKGEQFQDGSGGLMGRKSDTYAPILRERGHAPVDVWENERQGPRPVAFDEALN